MIQKHIEHIVSLLRDCLGSAIADVNSHIVTGPISSPVSEKLPLIGVCCGDLAIAQTMKESVSSQPRPQDFREEFTINTGAPEGPYALAMRPLQKSVRCALVFDKGSLKERRITLQEGIDFTLDYKHQAVSSARFADAGASVATVQYSFVGVFTTIEFDQDFFVDIYDAAAASVESWASLSSAILLTNHDELLDRYNAVDATAYQAGNYSCTHAISHIAAQGMTFAAPASMCKVRLAFRAHGFLKPVRAIEDGFGIIERIQSPAQLSDSPVDIQIDLDTGQ